jgi:hypothetical protein
MIRKAIKKPIEVEFVQWDNLHHINLRSYLPSLWRPDEGQCTDCEL